MRVQITIPFLIIWALVATASVMFQTKYFYHALISLVASLLLRVQWGSDRSVSVVVLGDIGHSPRMQYHALSLSQYFHVNFVGNAGSAPRPEVTNNRRISLHRIHPFPRALSKFPLLITAPLKIVFQSVQLLWKLIVVADAPTQLLIQVVRALCLPAMHTTCRPPFCLESSFDSNHVCRMAGVPAAWGLLHR